MALNQVIHGSNRVVENPNRYKLNPVAGQANTYDLEKQPGVITDNGTPYNKTILDKIDNVLSYLTPSVEKVADITPTITATLNGTGNDGSSNVVYSVDGAILQDGSVTKTNYKIYRITSNGSNYTNWNSAQIDNIFVRTSRHNSYNFYLQPYNYIEFDLVNPRKATICYYLASSSNAILQGSNDGITYDTLESSMSYDSDKTYVSNTAYRYYRLYANGYSTIYYLYLKDIEDNKITYENQFTLDNNTSFANNQRVLIETPKQRQIVIEDTENIEDNIWTLSSSTNLVSNKGYEITAPSTTSTNILNYIIDKDTTTMYSFNLAYGQNTNVIVDFKVSKAITSFQTNIKYIHGPSDETSVKLYYSDDSTNWTNYFTYSNNSQSQIYVETITNIITARYIKIEFGNTLDSSEIGRFYDIKATIGNYHYDGPDYDVSSNTLNGIDIPTLLEPSTKYELIYNEDTNKFEFGNLTENKPLFDITLSEQVNQVDLVGLNQKLQIGKVYCLIIDGDSNTAGACALGDSNIAYVTQQVINRINVSFFVPFIRNNIMYIAGFYPNNTTPAYQSHSQITNYEYLKLSNNSYTFLSGTRIIIKEVA